MNNQYAPPATNLDMQPSGGGITAAMIESLRKTKGWVLLVGILLFVFAAFMLFGGLAMMFAGASLSGAKGMPAGMGVIIGVFYLVFALIYGLLGLFLVKYHGAISRLLRDGSSEAMEAALDSQQKFWRLAGLIALVMVVFFVGAMVLSIGAVSMMSGLR